MRNEFFPQLIKIYFRFKRTNSVTNVFVSAKSNEIYRVQKGSQCLRVLYSGIDSGLTYRLCQFKCDFDTAQRKTTEPLENVILLVKLTYLDRLSVKLTYLTHC